MAKITLDRTYLYAGETYGPGNDVEIADAEALAAIRSKQAKLQAAESGAQPPTPTEPAAPPTGGNAPPADPLADAVGATEAQALRDMGFGDRAAIAAASDDDLMAVPGIGEAKLKKLRALDE